MKLTIICWNLSTIYFPRKDTWFLLVPLSILTLLYTLQCIRDSWDHLADPRLGCWRLIVLLLQLVRPTVSTLMNVGPRQWSSSLTAHWSFKNLWAHTLPRTSAIRISGVWDPGTSVFLKLSRWFQSTTKVENHWSKESIFTFLSVTSQSHEIIQLHLSSYSLMCHIFTRPSCWMFDAVLVK